MSLEAILKEYNDNSKATANSNSTFDLSKYFSTFIPKELDEEVKDVRILPGKEGETPFTTIYLHTKKVENQWKNFVCPQKEKGTDCPFCISYDTLMKNGTAEEKKTAYTLKPKKAYVLKVIDRAKEDEGVKFWRIKHNSKKAGYYDKIISLFKLYKADLSDPKTGRDIALVIERNSDGIPLITNTIARDPAPLHTDEAQATTWLNDGETWEDVYAVKSYDYLSIIATDGEPVWNSELKTHVDKRDPEANKVTNYNSKLEGELTMGTGTQAAPPVTTEAATVTTGATSASTTQAAPVGNTTTTQASTPTTNTAVDEEEDDLPF